ncbi:MAG TPA: hypothetical protein VND45_09415 [Thermoanaerobaculia bacterium]|jgi:hypothetical protein|nr:hypothetical protein [Thermoanaerobaculia bacterium]
MASSRKKSSGGVSGGGARTLRNVVTSAAATETIIDLVSRLGLVDIVVGRMKSKLEETDLDDLFDEVADYLKRNPEVLVVSLGALTVATGMLVWLQARKEWDGDERRGFGGADDDDDDDDDDDAPRATTSTGRVRRTTPANS